MVDIVELVESLAIDLSSDGDLISFSLHDPSNPLLLDDLSLSRTFLWFEERAILLDFPDELRLNPALSLLSEERLPAPAFFRLAGGFHPCTALNPEFLDCLLYFPLTAEDPSP